MAVPSLPPAQGTPQRVDDDEDSADGSDSDFGLSDRQFMDLWNRFRQGNEQVRGVQEEVIKSFDWREVRVADYDEVGRDIEDSEFGLADWQLFQLASRARLQSEAVAEETSEDPLQQFLRDKSGREVSPATAISSRKCPSPEELLEEQLPKCGPESHRRLHEAPRRLQASLVSSRRIDHVTWYLMRFEENDEFRYYMKRFNDFKSLDKGLRAAGRPDRELPTLPPSGRFGIRHRLNLGDFNTKRLQSLQGYVDALLAQAGSLSGEPVLLHFFGRGAPGRVVPPGVVRTRSCDTLAAAGA